MRPLILEFAETPQFKNLDFTLIEYSYQKNLSVMKGTDKTAIAYLNMDTSTETRTADEPVDSDNDYKFNLKHILDTGTHTLASTEQSDSDSNHLSFKRLMDTQTITESIEPTDSDR